MKHGPCPKCGANEILGDLRIHGGEANPTYVSIHEPDKRPFVWMRKSEQSHFRAYVCGACGYTESYAQNYPALNEGRKKSFKSS